ncbi:MAG TPA: hypothetical protein EYP52_10055, partial [Anaerolineae bacterium]|nr:hypothetical protein [Anaerolineae bacterium]
RETLLAARPWDLVIVDEAHHARRRDFLDLSRYRPNRMLELLNHLQGHTRGLLLLTATPMQVHPVEVWDLLNLLGLGGPWGADETLFLRFYEQLRRPPDEVDWAFILRLVRAELEIADGRPDPRFEDRARQELGLVDWERVRSLIKGDGSAQVVRSLPPQAKNVLAALVRHHTPLRRLVFRNTRALLREYARIGLLQDRVPTRDPQPVWVPMRDEERDLYDRIEEYITHFYRKYEGERKGLGFVMTVYRRRLTSSFYAVQRSLERRLAFLHGQADLELEEDLEQEALSLDADERLPTDRSLFRDEIAYIEKFLHDLSMLGGLDSKVAKLLEDLQTFFRQRETVLVFTQYTDTMDFLREQLRQSYGSHVACYSGRGGERWDGVMWAPTSKEEIKNAFRTGEIKILICTEAASEGLNLQTCGVLINYDMPWNPMRVEQRIGRVDRIGQRYDEVWIRNYFYEGTVEARVYYALSRRIDLFQDVVGPLQPILARVERTIEQAAMAPGAERERVLREELARIEAELDQVSEGWDLDEWAGQAEGTVSLDTPVTLQELAATLTTAPTLRHLFRPHETIEGAFWLRHEGGEIGVTFDPAVFDAHPNTLQFLTFGHPLLEWLLEQVAGTGEGDEVIGPLLRLEMETPLRRVAYYTLDAEGHPRSLRRLAEVREALESPPPGDGWTETAVEAARQDLGEQVEGEWQALQTFEGRLRRIWEQARAARAARILVRAALVELALGQQPALFNQGTYPAVFDKAAVIGLKRHGYPWTALLRIAQG